MMMMPPCPMSGNAQEFNFQQWHDITPPYVFSTEPPLVDACLFTTFFLLARTLGLATLFATTPPNLAQITFSKGKPIDNNGTHKKHASFQWGDVAHMQSKIRCVKSFEVIGNEEVVNHVNHKRNVERLQALNNGHNIHKTNETT